MAPFRKISKEEFGQIQMDSAVILNKFDITGESPVQPQDEIGLTTGDISIAAAPTLQNVLDDVNNCPTGLMEGVDITGWSVSASFTAVTATPAAIGMALGAADVAGDKVTGKGNVEDKDFKDLWFVGKKMGGGLFAVHLLHCIGTGTTFSYTKKNKGSFACNVSAHPSVSDVDPYAPPVEYYSTAKKE